jgi:hypothetical protein
VRGVFAIIFRLRGEGDVGDDGWRRFIDGFGLGVYFFFFYWRLLVGLFMRYDI